MDSEPKIYRVNQEGVERLARTRTVWVFVFFVLLIVMMTMASGQSADQNQRERLVAWGWYLIVVSVVASLIARKRLQRLWSSYRLQFDENKILRWQEGLPPMRLNRSEITKVEEVRGTGLTLRTNARLRRLLIPADLAGYEEVRDVISGWQTPQVLPFLTQAGRTSLQVGLVLLFFASWLICTRSGNIALVVPGALAFYGVLALGLADHQRNPNVSKWQKVIVWVFVLLQWKFVALPYLRICSAFVG
jgi:hypothetical protein